MIKLLSEFFQVEKKDKDDSFINDSPKVTRKRVPKTQSRNAKAVEESSSTRKPSRIAAASAKSTPATRKTAQTTAASYLAPSSAVIAAAGAATPSTVKTAAPNVRTYSRSAVKKPPQAQAEKENVTQQAPVPTPVKRSTTRLKRI